MPGSRQSSIKEFSYQRGASNEGESLEEIEEQQRTNHEWYETRVIDAQQYSDTKKNLAMKHAHAAKQAHRKGNSKGSMTHTTIELD